MIVHETAIHQVTVEFKLLQVSIRPSTMNQSPYHNGSCKGPEIQIVKHDNRPNLKQKW